MTTTAAGPTSVSASPSTTSTASTSTPVRILAEDLATLETYRIKSDGVATRTYLDQFECEQSCGMFFFPLEELPEDQQLQLEQSGFTNAALEVCTMRSDL